MATVAPIFFDHELKVQQSQVDAQYMAHAGFNRTNQSLGMDGKHIQNYELYYNSGWHATAEAAKAELQEKLRLAGWSSHE